MTREQYLLSLIAEEAAEVTQAATKAITYGLDEVYEVTGKSNITRLLEEFHDLYSVLELLMIMERGETELTIDENLVRNKWHKVDERMGYSKLLGIIND